MPFPSKTERFEYRTPESRVLGIAPGQLKKLAAITLVMCFLALAFTFQIKSYVKHDQGATASATQGSPRTPEGIDDFKLAILILLPAAVAGWPLFALATIAASRRNTLTLSADRLTLNGPSQGFASRLSPSWSIPLDDIVAIETRSPQLCFVLLQGWPTERRIAARIVRRHGRPIPFDPGAWFLPGDTARTPPFPPAETSLFQNQQIFKATPANLARLQAAYDDLPIVRALRARGIAITPVDHQIDPDLSAIPWTASGIVAGLALLSLPLIEAIRETFLPSLPHLALVVRSVKTLTQ